MINGTSSSGGLETAKEAIQPEVVFDSDRYEGRRSRGGEGVWNIDNEARHTMDRHLVCQQSVKGKMGGSNRSSLFIV